MNDRGTILVQTIFLCVFVLLMGYQIYSRLNVDVEYSALLDGNALREDLYNELMPVIASNFCGIESLPNKGLSIPSDPNSVVPLADSNGLKIGSEYFPTSIDNKYGSNLTVKKIFLMPYDGNSSYLRNLLLPENLHTVDYLLIPNSTRYLAQIGIILNTHEKQNIIMKYPVFLSVNNTIAKSIIDCTSDLAQFRVAR